MHHAHRLCRNFRNSHVIYPNSNREVNLYKELANQYTEPGTLAKTTLENFWIQTDGIENDPYNTTRRKIYNTTTNTIEDSRKGKYAVMCQKNKFDQAFDGFSKETESVGFLRLFKSCKSQTVASVFLISSCGAILPPSSIFDDEQIKEHNWNNLRVDLGLSEAFDP